MTSKFNFKNFWKDFFLLLFLITVIIGLLILFLIKTAIKYIWHILAIGFACFALYKFAIWIL